MKIYTYSLFVILVFTICLRAIDGHCFNFNTGLPEVQTTAIASSLYGAIVQTMPICCVDIFLYHPESMQYLLVLRKQKPGQDCYFFPGGRLCKGESFFACAQRKCLQELGLEVTIESILDFFATMFPDSEWDCPTHTVNCAILASTNQLSIKLDQDHASYCWVSFDVQPDNPYLAAVYEKAVAHIKNRNETLTT